MAAPSPSSDPEIDNARGAAWIMLSVISAAAMTLCVRWSSAELTASVIVMQRAMGGLALALVAIALSRRLRKGVRFSKPWLHVWRGGLIGVSTQLGFWTIAEIPLATATVLFFSAPIFAAVLSVPLLGERIGVRRGAAIAAGFLGVVIVMRPGVEAISAPMIAAVASSFLFALALMSSRSLANTDGPLSAYISSVVASILVCVPVAVPQWSLPSTEFVWLALSGVVVASMLRNIGDLQAYRFAEAAILAPLAYTRLIVITVAGYVIFTETPDVYTLVGGGVIVAAALYIAQRERLLKRQKR